MHADLERQVALSKRGSGRASTGQARKLFILLLVEEGYSEGGVFSWVNESGLLPN